MLTDEKIVVNDTGEVLWLREADVSGAVRNYTVRIAWLTQS